MLGPGLTVGDAGEDGLVAALLARYGPAPDWLAVPAGDDAAVLDLPAGGIVVSTDTLVEGEDFRRAWSGGHDVGVKTAAQNLIDVAAMGARPLALLVSLAAPADLPASWADALAGGLAEECARAGATMVGGDLSAAPQVVVTGTAIGVLDGLPAIRRAGARPGDAVALAGPVGRSAAGLALLGAGRADDRQFAGLVADHLRPQPPYEAGPRAARCGATAMIDTSDGLLRDAGRVAAASRVRLDLDPGSLVPDEELRAAGDLLGIDPLAWVLAGGEDHALLACFPRGVVLPEGFVAIGSALPADGGQGPDGEGEPGVLVGGRAWPGETGWRHFRPR
jgi:thiamine-monophosphate kinase